MMEAEDRNAVIASLLTEDDRSVAALITYDAKNVSKRKTSVDNVMARA
jgi:hypothetical protein